MSNYTSCQEYGHDYQGGSCRDCGDSQGEWVKIDCSESEGIMYSERERIMVSASKTDPDGHYGTAQVFTEWSDRDTEIPVIKNVRWFDGQPCEHYRFDV